MVADDTILLVVVDDERPCRPDGASLRGVLLEPKVQRRDSAVEVVGVVSGTERFGVPKSGQLLRPGSAHEVNDRGLGLCWTIERRRERLGLLFDMTSELYRQAMRAKIGASIDADAPLQRAVQSLLADWRHDAEGFGACVERCITARRRIEAYAQPQTVLEAWLAELSDITRDGAYVSAVWSV